MAARAGAKAVHAYLLWGQEEIRKKEALNALLDDLVPLEDRSLDVQYVDATNSGVTGDTLMHAVRDRAMFSEKRVVVVLNAGRLRGPRHLRTQEVLAAGIPTLPDFSTLILLAYAEDADERRGKAPFLEKLMAALKAHGKVTQFALPKPEEMAEWVKREVASLGKQIAPVAARTLAQRAGPDSQRVLQEARKLVSYIGDRVSITQQDVELMVAAPPDDNVFHVLDATMSGDRRLALQLLRQLRESGTAPHQIMALLGRTLRLVSQAKHLLDNRVLRTADAASVAPEVLAGLPEEGSLYRATKPGYGRDKLWDQAQRITWPHLHRALDRLAVTEAGTKGWEHGAEDPDLALELFVAGLCDTVRQEQPRSGGYGGYGRGR